MTAKEAIKEALETGSGIEEAVDNWLSGLMTDEELADRYRATCENFDLATAEGGKCEQR